MEIAGQNVLNVSKGLDSGDSSYNAWSQRDVKFEKFLKFKKYFDLHGRPVERSIVTLYFLCVSYVSLPTISRNTGMGMHNVDT